MKIDLSKKRLLIGKANSTILSIVAVAAFVSTFSLVSSKALFDKRSYQAKVIGEKKKARDQLIANIEAANTLVESYKSFVSNPTNVLGGSSTGQDDKDGDNARIVLDSLPSKYDFPAVTTSLEKMISARGYKFESINGIDDEVAQQNKAAAAIPEPVEIPFEVAVKGNYDAMYILLQDFERSIRPIHITGLSFSGVTSDLQLSVAGKTYYQPEKNLSITYKDVK